jgi:hypothetical protein
VEAFPLEKPVRALLMNLRSFLTLQSLFASSNREIRESEAEFVCFEYFVV